MTEFFYPENFLKRLAPDQVAMFEPVSGTMLLNVPMSEYKAAADRYKTGERSDSDTELFRAINHEVYHFAQTIGSGYAYARQQRLFALIENPGTLSTRENSPEYRTAEDLRRRDDSDGGGGGRRMARMLELVSDMERLSVMQSRAAPGDHSLAGAYFPDLFREVDALAAAEAESNTDGLSILAVIEGSAVVHAELLTGGTILARERIEAELAKLPPVYRALLDATVQRHGDRALELLLPTVALALRYTRPHDAYLPLLALVVDSPVGDALVRGRALSMHLPDIPAAGPILGTAIDVHQETEQYRVYATILRDLAAGRWNVDSYALLADPEAMKLIPSFPLGAFARDDYIGLEDAKAFAARTIIMGIVLRVQNRRWEERDFENAFMAWTQDLLGLHPEEAVAAYREALEDCPREQVQLQWAMTQRLLGASLYRLGEREPGTAHLQDAVAAYRRALEEYTRERVPLDWASTQNDLGVALMALGDRETDTPHLEEAIAAFGEALKEYTREGAPLQWATTTINLGTALQTVGARELGTARLEDAVAAYCKALEECTRERAPLQWAATQNNLGNALAAIGVRANGTARLEEAVAAYREALKERTRERVPLDWAKTQNNLGATLKQLGERESGIDRLEEAVAAIREALKEWTRDRAPLDWASAQNNLGNALSDIGERGGGAQYLEHAISAYREALKEYTRARVPLDWAMTQNNLGLALSSFGNQLTNLRRDGTPHWKEAVSAFRGALEERTRERVPLDWSATQNALGNVLANLGLCDSGTGYLEEAIAAYGEALTGRTREQFPLDWAMATGSQGVALMLLAERRGDSQVAHAAVQQIETALAIGRAGGLRVDFFTAMLPRARALCERLRPR
jgi:tetratricopeptide (TPR) repeat protein